MLPQRVATGAFGHSDYSESEEGDGFDMGASMPAFKLDRPPPVVARALSPVRGPRALDLLSVPVREPATAPPKDGGGRLGNIICYSQLIQKYKAPKQSIRRSPSWRGRHGWRERL